MTTRVKTACILCSINCGIEVELDGRRIAKVRGDKDHPASKGYTCEKPRTLDYYQNGRDRIKSPLRRRPNGTFEEIDWDTAINEIAAKLGAIRDEHGGEKILYYGGGGQGNHLGGAYSTATRAAMGSVFASNALAQEKTGEFWVDGQLFGRANCHTAPDFEHAEVAVFVGKNPWQSHGFPRARAVIREIAKDPKRTLIVIDPRRTETADLADHHLAVRPGGDAFALAAMLGVLVDEDLIDHDFVERHCTGAEALLPELAVLPIADYAKRAGLDEETIRTVTRLIANASSCSILEDLGIQQAPHSTLNSYLEKLIVLLTGNFGVEGGVNLHTAMGGLIGGGRSDRRSPVTGERIITGLLPCNAIPDEILSDHADRFRAMFIESANPVHSLADSQRMREALDALELVVVIDVAMTETARRADYVLPASSQYEKWEATFFTLEFPENVFHLRAPILDPLPGTLPEPEIHRRLVRALGALEGEDLSGLRAAAEESLEAYAAAFLAIMGERPHLARYAPVVLHETLGPALPEGAESAAVVWGAAQTCAMTYPESVKRAGHEGEGPALGNALFRAILEGHSAVVFSIDPCEETWARIVHEDGRAHVAIPELLEELAGLSNEDPRHADPEFPFVLSAGERRSTTANTIYRDPNWRRKDRDGALRMNPEDAEKLGIDSGGRARITTRRASFVTAVEVTDTLQNGHVSLPNGHGLFFPDDRGEERLTGIPANELTAAEDRDWLAGTPHHKHVPARVEAG